MVETVSKTDSEANKRIETNKGAIRSHPLVRFNNPLKTSRDARDGEAGESGGEVVETVSKTDSEADKRITMDKPAIRSHPLVRFNNPLKTSRNARDGKVGESGCEVVITPNGGRQ